MNCTTRSFGLSCLGDTKCRQIFSFIDSAWISKEREIES